MSSPSGSSPSGWNFIKHGPKSAGVSSSGKKPANLWAKRQPTCEQKASQPVSRSQGQKGLGIYNSFDWLVYNWHFSFQNEGGATCNHIQVRSKRDVIQQPPSQSSVTKPNILLIKNGEYASCMTGAGPRSWNYEHSTWTEELSTQ